MSTYAIGDVQGCYDELRRLLDLIEFDPARDRLLYCGDLVNRGPDSLGVLRFVKGLGDAALSILGNHDLHLLAVANGLQRARRRDTFDALLAAPDLPDLLEWLRGLPLVYVNESPRMMMIHAGLLPQWDAATVPALAAEVEAVLRGAGFIDLLAEIYGDEPAVWHHDLSGWPRLRCITNCLTRLRYCDERGRMSLADKGPPGSQRPTMLPWYEVPARRSRGETIVFGHWSTLNLTPGQIEQYRVYPLDTGCVWGGALSALRLEDLQYRSVAARQAYA